MKKEQINALITQFVLDTFLQDEDAKELNDSLELISGGIMDSISTLKLVDYIEITFDIEFEPHEVDSENLNSIALITEFIFQKRAK